MNVLAVCNELKCNQAELARLLNISRAAIGVWSRNKKIPLARQYQIRDLLAGRKPIGISKNIEPDYTSELAHHD